MFEMFALSWWWKLYLRALVVTYFCLENKVEPGERGFFMETGFCKMGVYRGAMKRVML